MAIATLIWGTLHPVGKVVLRDVSPLQLILARAFLTGLTLTLVLLAMGRLSLLFDEIRIRPLRVVGLGLLSFLGSSGLSMWGLDYLPASVNSLMANTSPLMLAFGLAVARGGVPAARVTLGLVAGFAGVALLALRGSADLGTIGLIGVLLSLGGSATWAVYTGWGRHELKTGDPVAITAAASFVGSVPLLLVAAVTGQVADLATKPLSAIGLLLYAGVIGTALTYALWMTGLRRLSATNVAAFQYVIPLSAVALSVIALGEPLTWTLVLGGALILLGVGLAQERLR